MNKNVNTAHRKAKKYTLIAVIFTSLSFVFVNSRQKKRKIEERSLLTAAT